MEQWMVDWIVTNLFCDLPWAFGTVDILMKVPAYIFFKPHRAGLIKNLISAILNAVDVKVMANYACIM